MREHYCRGPPEVRQWDLESGPGSSYVVVHLLCMRGWAALFVPYLSSAADNWRVVHLIWRSCDDAQRRRITVRKQPSRTSPSRPHVNRASLHGSISLVLVTSTNMGAL